MSGYNFAQSVPLAPAAGGPAGPPAGGPPGPPGPPAGGPPGPPGPPAGGPPGPHGPPAGGPPGPHGPPAGGPPGPHGPPAGGPPGPPGPPAGGPPGPPGPPAAGPVGGPAGGPPVVHGPVYLPPALLLPFADPYPVNHNTNQAEKNTLCQIFNLTSFAHRDLRYFFHKMTQNGLKWILNTTCSFRWIFNGNTPPVLNGGSPYPLTAFFPKYLSLFLFPHMMSPTQCHTLLGVTHQQLYEWRDKYTLPFLATPGPGGSARYVLQGHSFFLSCILFGIKTANPQLGLGHTL